MPGRRPEGAASGTASSPSTRSARDQLCLAIVPVQELQNVLSGPASEWVHKNIEVIGAIDKLSLPGLDPHVSSGRVPGLVRLRSAGHARTEEGIERLEPRAARALSEGGRGDRRDGHGRLPGREPLRGHAAREPPRRLRLGAPGRAVLHLGDGQGAEAGRASRSTRARAPTAAIAWKRQARSPRRTASSTSAPRACSSSAARRRSDRAPSVHRRSLVTLDEVSQGHRSHRHTAA